MPYVNSTEIRENLGERVSEVLIIRLLRNMNLERPA